MLAGLIQIPRLALTRHLTLHATAWLLPLVTSAIFFWPVLFGDQLLVPTDPGSFRPWIEDGESLGQAGGASNPLMADSLVLTCPWRLFNSQMLRRGELPFWNPDIFCGYPHLAALQSNSLYPPVVVCDLIDPLKGIGWAMAFHFALAGTLMLAFLRRVGLALDSAVIGALLFEFNGFFMVRMSAPSYVFTASWMPLLLLGLHEIGDGGRCRVSWKVAAAVALAFLGGHPQILVLVLVMGGAYLAVHSVRGRSCMGDWRTAARRWLHAFAGAGLSVALGLGLAGLQLLPFLELMGQSSRIAMDFGAYEKLSLSPVALVQAVIPDFFGHPVDGDYWYTDVAALVGSAPDEKTIWAFNYCGENLYTGVVPLIFAGFALLRHRSRLSLLCGAVVVTSLLAVLGTPVLRALYWLVPTFQHARSDRVIFLFMAALSLLAALGYDAWWRGRVDEVRSIVWSRLVILYGLLVFAACVWPVLVHPGSSKYRILGRRLVVYLAELPPVVMGQVVVALVTAVGVPVVLRVSRRHQLRAVCGLVTVLLALSPLFRFGWRFNPVQTSPLFPTTSAAQLLKAVERPGAGRVARVGGGSPAPANLGQLLGFADIHGASAAGLEKYVRLVDHVDPSAVRLEKYFGHLTKLNSGTSRLLDLLAVRRVHSTRILPLPRSRPLADLTGYGIHENPDAADRFYLATEVQTYRSADEAVERLLGDGDFDVRESVLVLSGARGLDRLDVGQAVVGRGEVELLSFEPHRIDLRVTSAGWRLLTSSEVHYPGWRAQVDGVPAEMVLVNTAFRGVMVPPGSHQVSFRYVPMSFIAGSMLSLVSLVAAFGLSRGFRGDRGRSGAEARPGECPVHAEGRATRYEPR